MVPPVSSPPRASSCPVCGRANGCVGVAGAPCWCDDVRPEAGVRVVVEESAAGDACLCRRCLTGRVPSPCVGVCQLDADGAYCTGCSRSLSEVAAWGSLGPAERAAVLLRVRGRLGGGSA